MALIRTVALMGAAATGASSQGADILRLKVLAKDAIDLTEDV
jgi:hypothetical protein